LLTSHADDGDLSLVVVEFVVVEDDAGVAWWLQIVNGKEPAVVR